MVYRLKIGLPPELSNAPKAVGDAVVQVVPTIMKDALEMLEHRAKENLSGIPFQSPTGIQSIQKRTGKAAASIQSQFPYGSPYRGRLFGSALSQYPGNEAVDYLAVLEYGRGEIRPKYTPSMQGGKAGRARLTIPGGPTALVQGQQGFRGISGMYYFVSRIPAKEGMYPIQSAAQASQPEITAMAKEVVTQALRKAGL